jgi:hypothetical protein
MAPLSKDLLAVIDALPSSSLQTLGTDYRQGILTTAAALDGLGSSAEGLSATHRAAKACKACEILFGDRAVTPQGSLYSEYQQKNWSVLPRCHQKPHSVGETTNVQSGP